MSMRKLDAGWPAACAVAGMLLSGGCATTIASQRVEGAFERTLAVEGDTLVLDVRTRSGRIAVTAGEPGTVRVTGHIRGHSNRWTPDGPQVVEDRVRAIETDPPVVLDGDVLRVGHLDRSRRRQVGINYEVVVPANTRVQARTGSGSLRLAGVTGAVEAKTGSGSSQVSDVAGDVTVDAGSGSIELTAVGGDIDVTTGSGSIGITGVETALRARTGSGRIRVEGSPGDAWDLTTGSGSIRIDLPEDAAFEIDARSRSGSVSSDHPVTVSGKARRGRLQGPVRGGGPRVTVRTGSGGITLE